jgi:hypothetical protein
MPACRSCGKEIEWSTTTDGKRMPMRADPQGEWVLIRPGVGLQLLAVKISLAPDIYKVAVAAQVISGKRWSSHFSDCKDANRWRKP